MKSSQVRSLTLRSSPFRPPSRQKRVITGPQKKQGQFWPPHKKHVNFVSHSKTKSIYFPQAKKSFFRPQHWSQLNFDPLYKNKSILRAQKRTIQTLNQVIFDPHTKPSKFIILYWNVSSRSPILKSRPFRPPTQQGNFDVNKKTMIFLGRVTLRAIHTSFVKQEQYIQHTLLILTPIILTSPYLVELRKYCVA